MILSFRLLANNSGTPTNNINNDGQLLKGWVAFIKLAFEWKVLKW